MLRRLAALAVLLAGGLSAPAKAQHAGALAELNRSCGAEMQAAYAEAAPRGMRSPRELEIWFIQALTGNQSSAELRKGSAQYTREAPTISPGYEGGWRYFGCALGVAARLKDAGVSDRVSTAKATPKTAKQTSQSAKKEYSPQFAAMRADILASCSAAIQRYAESNRFGIEAANSILEEVYLYDRAMRDTANDDRIFIKSEEEYIASGLTAAKLAGSRAVQCLKQRHLALIGGRKAGSVAAYTKAATGAAAPNKAAATPAAASDAPPRKGKLGTLKIILQLGNNCVKLRMLPYDPNYNEVHDSDRLEMRNECAVPQIVTTHIEMDDIPYAPMHYPPGLNYPPWMGKYPPKFDFLANDIRGATVMPQGAVHVQVYPAGRTLTAWIGACDAMTNNVFNRLYTDSAGAKGHISRIACVSNPEPPPKPRWPL